MGRGSSETTLHLQHNVMETADESGLAETLCAGSLALRHGGGFTDTQTVLLHLQASGERLGWEIASSDDLHA